MLSREDFFTIKQMRLQGAYIVDIATYIGCSERTVRRYKCILCGDRLRFAGVQAGHHATELLSERLSGMAKKRWLQTGFMDQCA